MTERIGRHIGYIRVSSKDQNPERQQEQLAAYNLYDCFIDYASGKDTERPQLSDAIARLHKGDTLVVYSMDRLARNLDDLRRIVLELTGRGVAVQFVKEAQTFTGEDTSIAKLLLSVMGAFAEFERSLIRERQLEGIAIAKAKGVYKGRKAALTSERIAEMVAKDKANNQKNRAALAREYSISRETLYQYLKASSVTA